MDGGEAMTPTVPDGFAADIEGALRATPGVRNVYRSGSLISHLLRAGAAALGSRDDGQSIVSVVAGDRGVVIDASVGIDFSAPAKVTLRSMHTAVDALLRAAGLPRESITLTVVYVQSPEAS